MKIATVNKVRGNWNSCALQGVSHEETCKNCHYYVFLYFQNLRRSVSFLPVCLHQRVVILWQMSGVLCWVGRKAVVFHRYSDSGEALIS